MMVVFALIAQVVHGDAVCAGVKCRGHHGNRHDMSIDTVVRLPEYVVSCLSAQSLADEGQLHLVQNREKESGDPVSGLKTQVHETVRRAKIKTKLCAVLPPRFANPRAKRLKCRSIRQHPADGRNASASRVPTKPSLPAPPTRHRRPRHSHLPQSS